MQPLFNNDLAFLNLHQISCLAGIDEAGRGCLAGPLVVAGVELDYQNVPVGLNDSKLLSAKRREALFEQILITAIHYCIVEIEASVIDSINIRQAAIQGFGQVISAMQTSTDFFLIDGLDVPVEYSSISQAVVKGDSTYACIAAASILAKVHRDRLMRGFDHIYPEYGFIRQRPLNNAPAETVRVNSSPV
ncbi:MAG TPA: ribonuclease HII, partial [Candidatus Cloacimonadota bacterium]|nr:ribonuclease HII [Candidatus Cloacimonadota bacterium]